MSRCGGLQPAKAGWSPWESSAASASSLRDVAMIRSYDSNPAECKEPACGGQPGSCLCTKPHVCDCADQNSCISSALANYVSMCFEV